MKTSTRDIIRAALAGDNTVPAEERRRILDSLDGPSPPPAPSTTPMPGEYVSRKEIARRLGVCPGYVGELVRKGVLLRAPGGNGHRVNRYAIRPA